MLEPDVPPSPPRRWRVWLALGMTAVAIPLVVLDNLPDEADASDPLGDLRVVEPAEVPADRAETGPPKGISVVTSSTTSSTLPLTTTTTTTTTTAPPR